MLPSGQGIQERDECLLDGTEHGGGYERTPLAWAAWDKIADIVISLVLSPPFPSQPNRPSLAVLQKSFGRYLPAGLVASLSPRGAMLQLCWQGWVGVVEARINAVNLGVSEVRTSQHYRTFHVCCSCCMDGNSQSWHSCQPVAGSQTKAGGKLQRVCAWPRKSIKMWLWSDLVLSKSCE